LISVASITFVIAGFLVLASVVQPAAERLHLPYTVLLAIVGVAIGGVSSFLLYTPLTDVFGNIVRPVVDLPFNASIFLVVFLPLLLFHAALTLDLREIAPDWAPILTLAIVAVFAAAAAIGFSLSFAAGVPLTVALLLGAIVATTDPSAVVAIFRELGAPARLTRLLEGESLLNDAAAIVLFSILVGMLTEGARTDFAAGVVRFAEAFLGGVVLGAAGGRLFGMILPFLGGSRLAEVTLSVALPYIAYLLAEQLFDVSGVVAVVSAGLTAGAIGRVRLAPDNWRYLERVWEQTGFWASSLIFISASTLVPKLLSGVHLEDAWLLLVAIAAALASRMAVLFGLLPLLSVLHLSQKVSGVYKLAITWGGLRGAVTLALALAVTENNGIDPGVRNAVAVLATGFVLFTLLVNGLTLRPVIRLLKLDRLSPLNQALRNKVLALSLADVRDALSETASQYAIPSDVARLAIEPVDRRIGELSAQPDLELAISDRDRIRIGLVALANRERRIIVDHHAQRTVSGAAIERLLPQHQSDPRRWSGRGKSRLQSRGPRSARVSAKLLDRQSVASHIAPRSAIAAPDLDPFRDAADSPAGARGALPLYRQPARGAAWSACRRVARRGDRRAQRGNHPRARRLAPAISGTCRSTRAAFSAAVRLPSVAFTISRSLRRGVDRKGGVRGSGAGARGVPLADG